MPIHINPMSPEQLAPAFAKRPRGDENVDDYVEILQQAKVTINSGLSIKTAIVTPDEGDSYTILADSADESDPAGITVRAAKRRFNLAARELGFEADWREVDGWLILKAVPLKPPANKDGKAK